ncbi:hypothetical protein trycra_183 [Candidatus Hodgkinia cicadicola]|uniref:Uncharacterized protein n=1 Tax=Candidatus Hodgkinia cicadicola TaxID=573658 RepID=A0ABX4MIU6_9HYPH|nr:hypothetical protein trycra_183 [Candidatus Hodgkinia cicadicola]
MKDYVIIARVAIIPEITTCQIWLAAIKMAEQTRWNRPHYPTKMYSTTGKQLWFKPSTYLKLGNNITSICFNTNVKKLKNRANWYLITAKHNIANRSFLIGLNGIAVSNQGLLSKTIISSSCKSRLDAQLRNSVPGPNQTFYIRILGTGRSHNIESRIYNKGALILGSESLAIDYWSNCFLAAYLVAKILKEEREFCDKPWMGLISTIFWSQKRTKASNVSNSCSSVVLNSRQYPERQRRLLEIQQICENELITGRQVRMPWQIKF